MEDDGDGASGSTSVVSAAASPSRILDIHKPFFATAVCHLLAVPIHTVEDDPQMRSLAVLLVISVSIPFSHQTCWNSGSGDNTKNSTTNIGQIFFAPESGSITLITLPVSGSPNSPNATCDIFAGLVLNATDAASLGSSVVAQSETNYTITFSAPILVQEGEQYTFLITILSESIETSHTTENDTAGHMIVDSASTDEDLVFTLCYEVAVTSPTPSATPSASSIASVSVTPSTSAVPASASATPSAAPTSTPTPSVSPSSSVANSPSISPSPSVSAVPTPSVTPSSSAAISPSGNPTSASASPSVSAVPTPSITPSATSSASITPSISLAASSIPSVSVTPTISANVGASASPSGSVTPTITPTLSGAPSLTPSGASTPSGTPSAEPTPTLSPSASTTPSNYPSTSSTPSITPSAIAPIPSASPATDLLDTYSVVNLRIEGTLAAFDENEFTEDIADILDIDPRSIQIISTAEGSVIVVFRIYDTQTVDSVVVTNTLENLVATNDTSLAEAGLVVLDLSVDTSSAASSQTEESSSSSGLGTGGVIAIAVAVPVTAIAFIGVGVFVFKRRHQGGHVRISHEAPRTRSVEMKSLTTRGHEDEETATPTETSEYNSESESETGNSKSESESVSRSRSESASESSESSASD